MIGAAGLPFYGRRSEVERHGDSILRFSYFLVREKKKVTECHQKSSQDLPIPVSLAKLTREFLSI